MRLDLADDDDPGINMTPMIDTMFLLLIFFLVATTFAKEDEVQMDLKLPTAQSGKAAERPHPLVIQVTSDGRLLLDGREVNEQAMKQKLLAAASRDPQQEVLIRGDRRVQFGLVAAALDACRMSRLSRIAMAAEPVGGH